MQEAPSDELRALFLAVQVPSRCWDQRGVWLHYTILSMPHRGGRVILLERLRWETLLLWLLHVAEERFGTADITYTERYI